MNLLDGPLQPEPGSPALAGVDRTDGSADPRLATLLAQVHAARGHPACTQDRTGWAMVEALARRVQALHGPARAWLCQRLDDRLRAWTIRHAVPGVPEVPSVPGVPGVSEAPEVRDARQACAMADASPAPDTEPAATTATAAAAATSTSATAASPTSPLRQLLVLLGAEGEPAPTQQPAACSAEPATAASGKAPATHTPMPATATPAAGAPTPARLPPVELKTLRQFRGSWQRLRSDQRLRTALATVPEQAGPLNSQHLVLRTLTQLQALSPTALDHCLSHLDALAWLDDATGAGLPGSASGAAGASRPGQAQARAGEPTPRRRGPSAR